MIREGRLRGNVGSITLQDNKLYPLPEEYWGLGRFKVQGPKDKFTPSIQAESSIRNSPTEGKLVDQAASTS